MIELAARDFKHIINIINTQGYIKENMNIMRKDIECIF